ncbi:MAG: hypothetical protein IT462_17345 [Planctomycetes bacterium]|nr:hypothetical protein [Planctomycetota bacterium]
MNLRLYLLVLAAAVMIAPSCFVDAQRFPGVRDRDNDDRKEDRLAGYELLGSRKVDFRDDNDTIEVVGNDGRFTAILFDIEDGNLEMEKVKVTFCNGEKYEPDTRLNFDENSRSRSIDLPGAARCIEKVEFDYESKGRRGRATINLYGRPVPSQAGHEFLGAQNLDMRRNRDHIDISDGGRYTAVLFELVSGELEMDRIEVVFGDDEIYEPDVRLRFVEGARTRSIDLPGRARSIKRVNFDYTPVQRRGRAAINVFGKKLVPVEMRFPGYNHLGSTSTSGSETVGLDIAGGDLLSSIIVEVEDYDVDITEFKFTIARTADRWMPDVRHDFRAEARSRKIDLPGNGCVVTKLDLRTRLRSEDRRTRATINVYGRGWSWREGEDWKEPRDRFAGHDYLASRKVDFKAERDAIKLGGDEGRFVALLVEVEGGSLEMYDIEVKFLNGETFSPKTRLDFDDRSRSRSFDLPGKGRIVSEVKFTYRSTRGREGRANINLYGKR